MGVGYCYDSICILIHIIQNPEKMQSSMHTYAFNGTQVVYYQCRMEKYLLI
jgi:hypothetical protein